ncbi:insulinase family protein [Halomonas sp. BM-2019]|uniref:insulinase family protein n=1 Tax=Halomonas sp. BM-2019 TaxID=2811227 RepID=UPI001B3C3011|nr:MAG: insulinase family protein [Halomonas sp. BM-2019]
MTASATPGAQEAAARAAGLPEGSRLAGSRLANGLRILAAEIPPARELRLVAAIGSGYLDEPTDLPGLAHLLEHALFLGSRHFPGEGELSDWVGRRGGRYNARTGETVTDLHLSLPPANADEGLARLVDLLCRPLLRAERIGPEVAVLDAEFRARLADPALHRLAALGQLAPPGHPARLCHAGSRATLGGDPKRLARRLRDFHRHHYGAQRLALVMAGPLPLASQLELLARHGGGLPLSPMTPRSRPWRWGKPGGLAWGLPPELPDAPDATLELVWPLPASLALAQADELAALAARLVDGGLSATLQAALPLRDLEARVCPDGIGPALGLRLDLGAEDEPPLGTLIATCQAALERAMQASWLPASPPADPLDLDDWPRRQAHRLVAIAEHVDVSDTAPSRAALTPWLAASQCRWLLRRDRAARQAGWQRLEATGTPCRALPLPPPPGQALSVRPAPPIVRRRLRTTSAALGGHLEPDSHLALWFGRPWWLPPGGGASWCLGWPAPPVGRAARLAGWRRHGLVLGQAAAARGLTLITGTDLAGDWLLASGDEERLVSLVSQSLAHWQSASQQADPATLPAPQGLIAQRLLDALESHPLPPAMRPPASGLLCWASGCRDAAAIRRQANRFSALLPTGAPAAPPPPEASDTICLTGQGGDQAVMLAITGPDDTPRSRVLLQLLAHCQDAAFQHELRQRRGLGYVAAVRYREAAGWPRLGYVVQSPHASVAALRQAIEAFLSDRARRLARPAPADFLSLRDHLGSRQGRPETPLQATLAAWHALRHRSSGPAPGLGAFGPAPWQAAQEALAAVTPDDLAALADALASGGLARHWWQHAPR